jgi:hypothetical protein
VSSYYGIPGTKDILYLKCVNNVAHCRNYVKFARKRIESLHNFLYKANRQFFVTVGFGKAPVLQELFYYAFPWENNDKSSNRERRQIQLGGMKEKKILYPT